MLIAIATLGPVGDETTAFFHELGRRIVAVTSEPRTMSFFMATTKCRCSDGERSIHHGLSRAQQYLDI